MKKLIIPFLAVALLFPTLGLGFELSSEDQARSDMIRVWDDTLFEAGRLDEDGTARRDARLAAEATRATLEESRAEEDSGYEEQFGDDPDMLAIIKTALAKERDRKDREDAEVQIALDKVVADQIAAVQVAIAEAIAAATLPTTTYCVSLPRGGESMWSRRDNNIGVRFVYELEIVNRKGTLKLNFTTNGYLSGEEDDYVQKYDIDHYWYGYGTADLCLDTAKLRSGSQWFVDNATKEAHGISFPQPSVATVKDVWLDIRWGGDCPRASATANHNFYIYRRRGDHINPFNCKWK